MSENKAKKRKKSRRGRPPRHGGFSLLTRGVREGLPGNRRYIGHYLTEVREGLIHDLAKSEEDLSTAQKVLIDRIITFLGVIRLVEEYAKEHCVLDSKGRPSQGLTGHYLTFNRQVKEMLSLLGINKKASDEILSPLQVAEEIDREEEEKKEKRSESDPKRRLRVK